MAMIKNRLSQKIPVDTYVQRRARRSGDNKYILKKNKFKFKDYMLNVIIIIRKMPCNDRGIRSKSEE